MSDFTNKKATTQKMHGGFGSEYLVQVPIESSEPDTIRDAEKALRKSVSINGRLLDVILQCLLYIYAGALSSSIVWQAGTDSEVLIRLAIAGAIALSVLTTVFIVYNHLRVFLIQKFVLTVCGAILGVLGS